MGRCLQRLIGHSCGRLTHENFLVLQSSKKSLALLERNAGRIPIENECIGRHR